MQSKKFSAQKRGRAYTAMAWGGAALALLGGISANYLIWVGLALLVIAVVYRFTMVRCPHCGSKLLGCQSVPRSCPDCGEELI